MKGMPELEAVVHLTSLFRPCEDSFIIIIDVGATDSWFKPALDWCMSSLRFTPWKQPKEKKGGCSLTVHKSYPAGFLVKIQDFGGQKLLEGSFFAVSRSLSPWHC